MDIFVSPDNLNLILLKSCLVACFECQVAMMCTAKIFFKMCLPILHTKTVFGIIIKQFFYRISYILNPVAAYIGGHMSKLNKNLLLFF